jgi:hypothetical protein
MGGFTTRIPQVQRKMEVVYWRSQGLGDEQIQRLCASSKAPFYRYLNTKTVDV